MGVPLSSSSTPKALPSGKLIVFITMRATARICPWARASQPDLRTRPHLPVPRSGAGSLLASKPGLFLASAEVFSPRFSPTVADPASFLVISRVRKVRLRTGDSTAVRRVWPARSEPGEVGEAALSRLAKTTPAPAHMDSRAPDRIESDQRVVLGTSQFCELFRCHASVT
jgi:hypothetical protein